MSETQQVQNSTGTKRSSDKIEDSFRRLKVNEDGLAHSSPYPGRPGERDCLFYMRTGLCGYGSNCRYNHPTFVPQGLMYYKDELPERVGQPDCEYFLKTGTCKYGSTCKYHHPKDRNGAGPVLFNVLGFPMRQRERPCPYYMRTGMCRFGVACKFHHPQPVNVPSSAYGVSSFPSVGLTYVGGLTTMSMPTATYGSIPRAQVPQAYMPIMVSPSQGVLPPQGWATYMAGVSSNYNAASNPMYNVKNQHDSSSSALGQSLPERPDQPECRYFMNTGTCRYGADCKYNHPKERISQLSLNVINSVALPSRPGQPVCSSFTAYGFCKFGANCKFDHSLPLYPYNIGMGMAMSPQPVYASSVSTPPKIKPPSHSDSTSPSNSKPPEKIQNPESDKQVDNPEKVDSELQVSSENLS